MSHDLICAWLKLPTSSWPPDHYTLLGLEPGDSDAARIDQQAHERLELLRRYQLAHPDQVTEAMNRLAQAFDCLSNPAAKKAYDAVLFPDRAAPVEAPPPLAPSPVVEVPAPPPAEAVPPAPVPPAVSPLAPVTTDPSSPDPLAWLYGPWSQGVLDTPLTPETIAAPPPSAAAAEPPLQLDPADPALQIAALSPPARRGLGTKRALYYRISRTRQLLRAWMVIGNYLGDAGRPLTSKAEAIELGRHLTAARQLLQDFPPILGQAGQPGYLVVVLSRQQMIVQTFRSLLPSQREALAKDWLKALELLAAHRRFLRDELWALRRRGWLWRGFRVVRALVLDHPGLWLLLLALLAVNLVVPLPSALRKAQAILFAVWLAGHVVYRTFFTRRAWLQRSRPSSRSPRELRAPRPAR
jgi:hypothetical protein